MSAQDRAHEAVVAWMIARSYATGHGDTIEDLLAELAGQIRDRILAAEARGRAAGRLQGIEEAAQRIEGGSFLHDSSPAYRFAKEATAAIRALAGTTP